MNTMYPIDVSKNFSAYKMLNVSMKYELKFASSSAIDDPASPGSIEIVADAALADTNRTETFSFCLSNVAKVDAWKSVEEVRLPSTVADRNAISSKLITIIPRLESTPPHKSQHTCSKSPFQLHTRSLLDCPNLSHALSILSDISKMCVATLLTICIHTL